MRREIIDASQLELEEKVVAIKRVTKVTKGGRDMRFSALVVVGDGNGHVGAGLGKAAEIPEAIRKGKEDAMKKLVTVARDENNSITHDFIGKFGSAEMLLNHGAHLLGGEFGYLLLGQEMTVSQIVSPVSNVPDALDDKGTSEPLAEHTVIFIFMPEKLKPGIAFRFRSCCL